MIVRRQVAGVAMACCHVGKIYGLSVKRIRPCADALEALRMVASYIAMEAVSVLVLTTVAAQVHWMHLISSSCLLS
jgi:hypothetical protein